MPKLKRLLVSACFETAQRPRQCSRNKGHVICKGYKCLVIKENMAKNNYCMECAALIIQKAQNELNALLFEIGGETQPRPHSQKPNKISVLRLFAYVIR